MCRCIYIYYISIYICRYVSQTFNRNLFQILNKNEKGMCTLQDWLPLDSRVAQRMSFDRLRALGPMRRPYHEPRASERRAIASAEMQDACLVESRDICLRRSKTGVVGVLGNSFYSTPAERNLQRDPLCRRPRAYLCGGARKPARC